MADEVKIAQEFKELTDFGNPKTIQLAKEILLKNGFIFKMKVDSTKCIIKTFADKSDLKFEEPFTVKSAINEQIAWYSTLENIKGYFERNYYSI